MSYILDALRRADAERDRGNVPSLHTQPAGTAGGYAVPIAADGGGRWRWVGAGVLGLGVAGIVAWRWFGSPSADPDGAAARPNAAYAAAQTRDATAGSGPTTNVPTVPAGADPGSPSPRMAAPGALSALPPMPERAAPVTSRPTTSPSLPQTASRQPAVTDDGDPLARTPPTRSVGRPDANLSQNPAAGAVQTAPNAASLTVPFNTTTGARGPSAGPAAPVVPTAANPQATTSGSPAAASGDRVYALGELPDEMQREIPKLGVGGSMYSPSPASRLLIVNGQVLHEGDTLSPGLVLRQIRLKSAVFSYRDRRFEIRY